MPMTPSAEPLHWWTATRLRDAIARGQVSAVEVMTAFLDRIEATNDDVNVLVFQLPREQCLAIAAQADTSRAAGARLGPLHGLPIAIKDLVDVAGMPTSRASRACADGQIKDADASHVAKLRAAGALIIGKTNSPEFGVGALTFNDVFGVTRNPFDLSRNAGGSSGGAAAVAAGMLPFCDGSDSGGSLRYPASFCNIVGLRTTPGIVPAISGGTSWEPHSVVGPMARNCRDAALLLSGMSGHDGLAPLSTGKEPTSELGTTPTHRPRLAWNADLGGLPVEPAVREVVATARARLEAAGVQTEDVTVDFEGVDHAWQVIEMFGWFTLLGTDPVDRPDLYRDDVVTNVAEAMHYSTSDLKEAIDRRYRCFQDMSELLDRGFDGFVCPGAPVVAPPAEVPWIREIDHTSLDRYFVWQRMACRLVVTAHPVLALPAGFAPGGLPVGLQIVGRPGQDVHLLELGESLEGIFDVSGVHPAMSGSPTSDFQTRV